ncbi:MAG: ribonuclease D [Verrucomicrobiota bacterium]
MITRDDQLMAFAPELQSAPWVALDTEADSLHTYPEKLCLVQLSIPGRDVLVDPLAQINLAPLWPVLTGHELILHGADYDLHLLVEQAGFVPTAVFDTMLAARILGYDRFGLGDLVTRHCGVTLEKGSQKADWSRRPLTPKLEAYARNDTRYLKAIETILRAELTAKGRLAWHQEMCTRLVAETARATPVDPNEIWRVKGSFALSRPQLAVLREVWHWREQEALASKRPPFFIMSHDALIGIARAAVAQQDLTPILPRKFYPPRRDRLEQAVGRGLAVPANQQPLPPHREKHRMSYRQRKAFEALQGVRDRQATALMLDPSLIASKATLIALASDGEVAWQKIMSWQRDLMKG